MDHIRGEKVVFGKDDFHPLEALPSAQRSDAAVLHTPVGRSWFRLCFKSIVSLALIGAVCISMVFAALEEGYLDSTLTKRAEAQLSNALGDEFSPKVGSVRLRFTRNWLLGLAVGDVRITHIKTGVTALTTDSIKVVFDPLALLMGHLTVAQAEIGTAQGDLRFLPANAPIDWSRLRIDAIPDWLDLLYPALDSTIASLKRANTEHVLAGRLSLRLPKPTPQGDSVALTDLDFSHPERNRYLLKTGVEFGKVKPDLTIALDTDGTKATAINLNITDLASGPIMMKNSKITHERRYGIDLPLDFGLTAERGQTLMLRIGAGKGLFYADGIIQAVQGGEGLLVYDFKDRKFQLEDGMIDVSPTRLPVVGTLLDLDRKVKGHSPGIAFEVVSNGAVASAEGLNLKPEKFNMHASGFFEIATKLLQLDTLGVATAEGNFAGSLAVKFVEPSPAVNFAARAEKLTVDSVRQIWPYWFGAKVRNWVVHNIAGGMVRDGQIDISLAAGRIPEHPIPIRFEKGEIHIGLDIDGASVRFINEMPASVNTSGHVEMQDRNVTVSIAGGEIALPSGRVIKSSGGQFSVDDISNKPLMGAVDLDVAADAAAALEITGFPPINALSRAPFASDDLTGRVSGNVQAVFGLEKEQNPPKPDWNVALDLNKVSLKKPFQDRRISDLSGKLSIDDNLAKLDGEADIDDIHVDVAATEPIDKTQSDQRSWRLSGRLGTKDIAKISPSLSELVSGEIGVDIRGSTKDGDVAALDLGAASVSVPVVGWRKGVGIPATAEFKMASRNGVIEINDFNLQGDGFGASGSLKLDKKGLASAKFNQVRLSSGDDFAVAMARKSGGLDIDVSGNSIDLRPLLDKMKNSTGDGPADAGGGAKTSDSISARLDRVEGYNKEGLTGITLALTTRKGQIQSLKFGGVTRSGQAVVVRKNASSGAFEVASGDAGALARFADIYKNMTGGLLNISLKSQAEKAWSGSVDIRNFALVNEQRLKSIVSSRSGDNGESLSDAVKTDIDTSSQKFRRGFARVMINGKTVRVENGIARGDQVGATFQGTVRDASGRMDMTGTFMPAYGLNSLFGQLPIIGDLLGNGRDRGLLGITFKLVGPYDTPRLTVNPLSLIAPGVFRNIFEFE